MKSLPSNQVFIMSAWKKLMNPMELLLLYNCFLRYKVEYCNEHSRVIQTGMKVLTEKHNKDLKGSITC